MPQANNSHRLFFALWPTDQVRRAILHNFFQLSSQLNGVSIRPENIHLTLHFIGNVTKREKNCLHHAAQTVQADSFTLELNRFGHFSRAKIFWTGPQVVPTELIKLHSRLGASLATCGYKSETRPYKPHVTLLRKYKANSGIAGLAHTTSLQTSDSIYWQVTDFVLVESIVSKRCIDYQVIEKYLLS